MDINRIKQDYEKAKIYRQSKNDSRDLDTWIFGEWFGNRCYDNSMYLANYIASNHPEVKLYWVAKETADTSPLDKCIKILKFDKEENIELFKNAGVIIMSQGLLDLSSSGFNYFNGAITVNLWHGVPWKRIGADNIAHNRIFTRLYSKALNNLIGIDYYLSTSSVYTKILKTAFLKRNGSVIKSGYPRNSLFYDNGVTKRAKESVVDYINQKYKTNYSFDTLIISYLPTFRDNVKDVFSFRSITHNSLLTELIHQNNAIIIEKQHYVNINREHSDTYKDSLSALPVYNYDQVGAQELLAATDILITDYSGCFFDFLLLDRPIIHFLYDYDYYNQNDRGLYFSMNEVVAGDVAYDFDNLVLALKENIDNKCKMQDRRKKIRSKYMEYEIESSCEDIYNAIRGLQHQ